MEKNITAAGIKFLSKLSTVYFNVIVFLFILITILMGYEIRNLHFDTSSEGVFEESDPIIIDYDNFRSQFGKEQQIIILFKSEDIFSFSFISKLKRIHRSIELDVPNLQSVYSLINVKLLQNDSGMLIVRNFEENEPVTEQELDMFRYALLSIPNYKNFIFSEDQKYAAILIKLDTFTNQILPDANKSLLLSEFEDTGKQTGYISDNEKAESISKILSIIESYETSEEQIYLGGHPIISYVLKKQLIHDLIVLFVISYLVIGVIVFILLRRISIALIMVSLISISVVWTIGLMALLQIPFKLPNIILPSLLMTVGICDCIHFIVFFLNTFEKDHSNKKEAIKAAYFKCTVPIILTTITTVSGLYSFAASTINPIKNFGIFASTGVFFALVITLLVLPSFLMLLPISPTKKYKRQNKQDIFQKRDIWGYLGGFSVKYSSLIIFLFIIITGIVTFNVTSLHFSHDSLDWLPDNSRTLRDASKIDTVLNGSQSIEILVDFRDDGSLKKPEILRKIELFIAESKKIADVKYQFEIKAVSSIVNLVKEINWGLNDNDLDFYLIPSKKEIISQELLLLDMQFSESIRGVANENLSVARISMKVPNSDAATYVSLIEDLKRITRKHFNDDFKITFTGGVVLQAYTIYSMIQSTISSYLLAGIAISVFMFLIFRKISIGIISIIPNLLPIAFILGVMGWMNIKLDMFTLLIGSIALGVIVDDTTHLLYHFCSCVGEGEKDIRESIDFTLKTTGKAILTTSMILSSGFLVFSFSSFNILYLFGFLLSVVIIFALITDILLLPALLNRFYK